ncbi:hypothetical protein [Streptomyces sp. NPDC051219]|uniref:hypothetical protein n=1 Tax=Streptomyces sp. NPDC051219 TaxID=3155283 RepID=UPI00343D6F91
MDARETALRQAYGHAVRWLASLSDRRVPARASVDEIVRALGVELPDGPSTPAEVVDLLVTACEPGLTAFPSGRFYGFVVGGTEPAALAADWLVSAWDQNCVMRAVSRAYTAAEDIASACLLDLLGLPGDSAVGFTTGATMANFTCLAAGRDAVLRRTGWNVPREGLSDGPAVHVIVGEETATCQIGTHPPRLHVRTRAPTSRRRQGPQCSHGWNRDGRRSVRSAVDSSLRR